MIQVLESIESDNSLQVFSTIASAGLVSTETLKQTKGLSKKQFYSITREMLKAGIVQRIKGHFSLTAFGLVIYYAQKEIDSAVKYYWKLKAIDSIQSSGQIGEQECTKLVKTMFDDENIQNILLKAQHGSSHVQNSNYENKSVLVISKRIA